MKAIPNGRSQYAKISIACMFPVLRPDKKESVCPCDELNDKEMTS